MACTRKWLVRRQSRPESRPFVRVALCLSIAYVFLPFGQVTAAESELDGIDIVPLDPSISPAQILAARPFIVPGDRCPVFCIVAETATVPLDEAAARSRLSHLLIARGVSEAIRTATVRRFDAPETRAIVANPTLRASLLMLSGWSPYDAVVAAVLDGENQSGLPFADISFQAFDSGAIAFLGGTADGRFALRINREFAAEEPETLANVLIHETLHDPRENSYEEEVIANILDGVAYAEMLLVRPELASTGSTLTVYNNFALLALLNSSGRAGPAELGISTSRFGDVWLGDDLADSDASSLRDAIASDDVYAALPRGGSKGGPVLTALLAPFPDSGAPIADPAFDERALSAIDGGMGTVISPAESVVLAETLDLALAGPISETGTATIGPPPTDPAEILLARPFVPRDVDRFDPTYAAAVRLTLRSDRSARLELADLLDALDLESDARIEVLDRFDENPELRIASPTLRAAVALIAVLPGGLPVSDTLLQPDSDSIVATNTESVDFAPLPHGTSFAVVPVSQDAFRIEINADLASESLALLASTLLEAALAVPAPGEESSSEDQAVVAAAAATIVYAELLIASPDLAAGQTWVTARANCALLALLNSTPVRLEPTADSPIGSVGILDPAEGVADVLPNLYADPRSFEAEVLARPGATDLAATRRTTAPPLAVAVAGELGVAMTAEDEARPPTFGDLLFRLDARLGALLPPDSIVPLAEALDLGVAESS